MGGAARSCVADPLKSYTAFLHAHEAQASSGETATAGLPFKQVIPIPISTHLNPPQQLRTPSLRHAMGQVPSPRPPRPSIRKNSRHLSAHVPTIGQSGPSRTTLNHAGSMPGAMAAAIRFPDSNSAVIVLSNTLRPERHPSPSSCTEILFDAPAKHGFVALMQEIIDIELKSMRTIAAELERDRTTEI